MRLRPSTINHRLLTCQPTARVYGLLDRVGDALAEERECLELKAIEMTRRNNEQTVAGRHRMMRRADREVADPQQVEAIIATCKIVSLAYTDAEGITIVPLNFGYVFDTESNHLTLYFHGSATGRKMDAVKAAGNALPVAFEMATDCEVVEGRTLCNWGEAFKSIVGNGTASIIDNLDEARQGLALLMKQQAGMEHVEFTDQQVRAVTVWKVEADYFTAKVREKPQPHMH